MTGGRVLLVTATAALAALGAACRSTDAGRPAAVSAAAPADQPDLAPAETAYKNAVKWTTASELDNFGFDVYRSESPDGPFERINPETIEGGGTTDEPRSYRYVDDTIDPHKTYYYYVESISMSGVREKFTPTGKAPPKIPPTDRGARETGDS